MTVWEAVIKVAPTDEPARRARDISDGLSYAAVLLRDEYGWSAEQIRERLEFVADEVEDFQ